MIASYMINMIIQLGTRPYLSKYGFFLNDYDMHNRMYIKHQEKLVHIMLIKTFFIWIMILPQVHLRKPCYDFYFL